MNLDGLARAEWLEADGHGGFASGTASGIRTRRYHGLLLAATTPPGGRRMLISGFDAEVVLPSGTFALSSQHYVPDVVSPDGNRFLRDFSPEPWPRWTFALPDGVVVEQEIWIEPTRQVTALCFRLRSAQTRVLLRVRLFLSGRDYHALHHENPAFRFDPVQEQEDLVWRPYDGMPPICVRSSGHYIHEPLWYRNFLYTEEAARGLDAVEDLAAPGRLEFDLDAQHPEAAILLSAKAMPKEQSALRWSGGMRDRERSRRSRFASRLEQSADAYLVQGSRGRTMVAGYPWFTEWGRDTFIALRGLCFQTGRMAEARDILLSWSDTVDQGMLPNRFPDEGQTPEYNSVDASLWYVIAAAEYLDHRGRSVPRRDRDRLMGATRAILDGYAAGTRYGIRMDTDGLLQAGVPGTQLTWMDAKVGDSVVTPRIGKPVEVQALWLNALRLGGPRYAAWFARGYESFGRRFIAPQGYLYDVIDVDHEPGTHDATFRPNQIFAIGGLPLELVTGPVAKTVVDQVQTRLWTPLGLRSLAPEEPGYSPRYRGGARERDFAYHQGTVWPWLIGPFVEAFVRVAGSTDAAKREAHARFIQPLVDHLDQAGLGHVSEIADGEPPHNPRGCPFQAWSLGELLRIVATLRVHSAVDKMRSSSTDAKRRVEI